MSVCMKLGLPHSAFASWDRDDRDKALWFEIHEREACPSCGTRAQEWDPKRGGDRDAFEAVVVGCRGCQVKARAEETFEKRRKEYPRGSRVVMQRRPDAAG